MRIPHLAIVLGCLLFISAQAQQSMAYFEPGSDFKAAKTLYDEDLYRAAQTLFEDISRKKGVALDRREKADFYGTLCAVALNIPNADKRLDAFLADRPELVYGANTYAKLADHYLAQGNYVRAYDDYAKALGSDAGSAGYSLKRGYAALMLEKYDEALPLLKQAINSPYRKQALYYAGHAAYAKKNYPEALQYFDPLKEDDIYRRKVLPYIAQIDYQQGKYQEAIQAGEAFLKTRPQGWAKAEILKIIGESCFRLKRYEAAIPYLEAYGQGQGDLSNSDHYQLGYAYYQKKDDEKAIAHFNKIVGKEDALSQTAYYQLAHAYLRTGRNQEALSAFHSAAQMDHDSKIKEDAWYNYAKLSYDLGNPFESAPDALQAYLKAYPRSARQAEVYTYLASAYTLSGNYKRALDILDNLKEKNSTLKAAEQKAAYLYGIQLFNQGNHEEALAAFERAARIPLSAGWREKANYWKGESLFRLGNYQAALRAYKTARIPSEKNLDYALGYVYLKLKDYPQAINAFERFISKTIDEPLKRDALLRLADSYYGAKKYSQAIEAYEKVEKSQAVDADYAAYQKALSYAWAGQIDRKAEALKRFLSKYPNSPYRKRAFLALGDMRLEAGRHKEAIVYYDQLIAQYPQGEAAALAQLKKGLAWLNQDQSEKALKAYKTVVERYPETEAALQAMQGVKNIYVEKGKIEDYQKWMNSVGRSELSEVEKLSFDAAERQFVNGKYPRAEKLLKAYIEKYPRTEKTLLAQYYLGETVLRMKKYDEAIPPLTQVAMVDNPNKDEAQRKLAEIYLKKNRKTEALLALESLYQGTEDPSQRAFATPRLMQLYSEAGNHPKALELSRLIEANPKSDQLAKEAATLVRARAALDSQDLQMSQSLYTSLKTAQNPAVRAEALYHEAYFKHQEKKYKASNKLIFELASQYPDQQYWGAKALIVMSENYRQLDDIYQATYTLKKLIENFDQYPDIKAEAQKLLDQIRSKKSKKSR